MKKILAQKFFQFSWLGIIALLTLGIRSLFFSEVEYAKVFVITHLIFTLVFTQGVLGIAEIIFNREEPWMDLLKFLLYSIFSLGILLLIALLISTIFKIQFAHAYIGIVIFFQAFIDNKDIPTKEEAEPKDNSKKE